MARSNPPAKRKGTKGPIVMVAIAWCADRIAEGKSSGDVATEAAARFGVSIRTGQRYVARALKALGEAPEFDITAKREYLWRALERHHQRLDRMGRSLDELKAQAEKDGQELTPEDMLAAIAHGKDANAKAARVLGIMARVSGVVAPANQLNFFQQNNVNAGVMLVNDTKRDDEDASADWAERAGNFIDAEATEQ